MIGFPGLHTARSRFVCSTSHEGIWCIKPNMRRASTSVGSTRPCATVVRRSVFLHASQTNMLQLAKEWQRKLLVDGAGSEE